MSGAEHVRRAAALRGQKKFPEAIAEIESNRAVFDDISTVPALLQAFYAAREGKNEEKAKSIAAELVKLEPGIPSLKGYV